MPNELESTIDTASVNDCSLTCASFGWLKKVGSNARPAPGVAKRKKNERVPPCNLAHLRLGPHLNVLEMLAPRRYNQLSMLWKVAQPMACWKGAGISHLDGSWLWTEDGRANEEGVQATILQVRANNDQVEHLPSGRGGSAMVES